MVILVFDESEIQEKIGRKFPKEEEVLKYIKVVIEEPKITLLGDKNRIQLEVEAKSVIPFLRTDKISGVFESSIRYEKEDHTLRISDFQVITLNTKEIPEQYEALVRAGFNLAAKRLIDDRVVYTIKRKDYKNQAAELLLQEIKVKKGQLEVLLGL